MEIIRLRRPLIFPVRYSTESLGGVGFFFRLLIFQPKRLVIFNRLHFPSFRFRQSIVWSRYRVVDKGN